MEKIPAAVVEATWDQMAALSQDDAPGLLRQFQEEQPALVGYLAAESDDLNTEEKELLLFLGLTVWRMMSAGEQRPPAVSVDMLEAAEGHNVRWLESLERKALAQEDDAGLAMLQEYPQADVLQGILEALMGEDADDSDGVIRDENKGLLLLSLKTVIDCLDA